MAYSKKPRATNKFTSPVNQLTATAENWNLLIEHGVMKRSRHGQMRNDLAPIETSARKPCPGPLKVKKVARGHKPAGADPGEAPTEETDQFELVERDICPPRPKPKPSTRVLRAKARRQDKIPSSTATAVSARSGNKSNTNSAAAGQVFNVAEFVQGIYSHLDPIHILAAQGINATFWRVFWENSSLRSLAGASDDLQLTTDVWNNMPVQSPVTGNNAIFAYRRADIPGVTGHRLFARGLPGLPRFTLCLDQGNSGNIEAQVSVWVDSRQAALALNDARIRDWYHEPLTTPAVPFALYIHYSQHRNCKEVGRGSVLQEPRSITVEIPMQAPTAGKMVKAVREQILTVPGTWAADD